LGLPARANLLLFPDIPPATPDSLSTILQRIWKGEDAQLELRYLEHTRTLELRSQRVFLDPSVVQRVLGPPPPRSSDGGRDSVRPDSDATAPLLPGATGVLSYFVNEIRHGTNATPYSVVSAPGEPLVPADLAEDEVILNDWLALDLGATAGDRVEMTYFVMGPLRQLRETTAVFRVHSVIPLGGRARDPDLMPAFPGLADAASCRDWDPGVPVDLSRIRKKDEQYWEENRGTPKAFVTLKAAQRMWSNRFGDLTAIRFPAAPSGPAGPLVPSPAPTKEDLQRLEQALLSRLAPEAIGLQWLPLREASQRASVAAVDFGQLFLGLSLFLILAALLLTAMLFGLSVEARGEEAATLRALGFRTRQVFGVFLGESALALGPGVVLGCLAGMGYTHLVLAALGSVWRGAVSGVSLRFDFRWSTMLLGIAASLLVCLGAVALVVGRRVRKSVQESRALWLTQPQLRRRLSTWLILAMACGLGAGAIVFGRGSRSGREAAGLFFGAGSLCLAGMLMGYYAWLLHLSGRPPGRHMRWLSLALRNTCQRSGRSLMVAAALACGIFVVIAVAANRHDPASEAPRRDSGTGGFAYYGQTTLPILQDLNTPRGRQAYSLDDPALEHVRFVMVRLREGDDASCLNLNRAQQPALLGIDPRELAQRGAFRFVALDPRVHRAQPWDALNADWGLDLVPAVADQTVMMWGLGKSIGDTLDYQDERGRPFRIRFVGALANSILQGKIIIPERAFTERFPSISGARVVLVDAPADRVGALAEKLSFGLQDVGLELVEAPRRLADFNQVERTYLSIFLVLGGLGMVLGSVGMGVLVMRNVLERRGELALMRAIGFSRRSLQALLFAEHSLILLAGLTCALVPAWVATSPALNTPGPDPPWALAAPWLGLILGTGLIWIWIATRLALPGNLLDSLRQE
jgi:putative ABC transport system permease protein